MSSFTPSERGTTIRQPSTANLMLDSADRDEARFASPWDFQITKPQSILNGFFTRIATTEVVLEWDMPNGTILATEGTFDLSYNNAVITIPNPFVSGVYYNAKAALDALESELNTATAPNTFTVQPGAGGLYGIATAAQTNFQLIGNPALLSRFGFSYSGPDNRTANTDYIQMVGPDFRSYRYLDFVSAQLTYCQDLKDAATNQVNRDVLCRWYMAWDNPPQLDAYGYPILMGYEQFVLRRLFNPPKQIRWDNIQPIGNLAFQVYGDDGNLVRYQPSSAAQWLMTLQVSEV